MSEMENVGQTNRTHAQIIEIIKSHQTDEPLLYFVAGVLLGKNRREFINGSNEEVIFFAEMLEILDEAGRSMRKIARRRNVPLDDQSMRS